MKLEFSPQIFQNPQVSNFIKICPVGAELLNGDERTDGQTDMTKKLIVAVRNFSKAPKNSKFFKRTVFTYCVGSSEQRAVFIHSFIQYSV